MGYDFEYATTAEPFTALRCSDCRLVYLSPRPAAGDIAKVFPDGYHAFDFSVDRFGMAYRGRSVLEARRMRGWTCGLSDDARILDAGCGDGFHLELLRGINASWHLEGLDPDARAVAAARERGFTVSHQNLEELHLDGGYDRIFLIATLEQLSNPRAALARLGAHLAPGGRLVLVTNNTDTAAFRLFRDGYWGGYHFPRHFQLFDRRSLAAIAEASGLRIEDVSTLVSPVNLVYSFRNALVAHGAPTWLTRRFSRSSPVGLTLFTVVDALAALAGRGSLLSATLSRDPALAEEGLERDPTPSREALDRSRSVPAVTSTADDAGCVILGAGFAGLTAATRLQRAGVGVTVYEAAPVVGGLARSFKDEDGFSFDFGAHFITNRLAAVLGVGTQCRVVHRYDESVLLDGRQLSYPFGLLRNPGFVASALMARTRSLADRTPEANAGEWFRRRFGNGIAEHVALPLLEAWSGARAENLSPAVGDKMPGTAEAMLLSVASRVSGRAVGCGYSSSQRENWNVWHVYPREGVGSVIGQMATALGDQIQTDSPVERIHVEDGAVRGVTTRGTFVPASTVFSTAPVHILGRLVEGADLSYLERFRYRPMVFVNFMLRGRGFLPSTMLWTPEARFPFFRLAEAPLSMPWLAPEGHTILTADIGCEVGDEFWNADDEQIVGICAEALSELIPDLGARQLNSRVLRTRFAYPVLLAEYEDERRRFQAASGVRGLYSIGRNGRFSHDLMEDVYWHTVRTVEQARSAGPLASSERLPPIGSAKRTPAR